MCMQFSAPTLTCALKASDVMICVCDTNRFQHTSQYGALGIGMSVTTLSYCLFHSIQGENKMEKSRKNQGKRNRSESNCPEKEGHTKQMKREEQQAVSS